MFTFLKITLLYFLSTNAIGQQYFWNKHNGKAADISSFTSRTADHLTSLNLLTQPFGHTTKEQLEFIDMAGLYGITANKNFDTTIDRLIHTYLLDYIVIYIMQSVRQPVFQNAINSYTDEVQFLDLVNTFLQEVVNKEVVIYCDPVQIAEKDKLNYQVNPNVSSLYAPYNGSVLQASTNNLDILIQTMYPYICFGQIDQYVFSYNTKNKETVSVPLWPNPEFAKTEPFKIVDTPGFVHFYKAYETHCFNNGIKYQPYLRILPLLSIQNLIVTNAFATEPQIYDQTPTVMYGGSIVLPTGLKV